MTREERVEALDMLLQREVKEQASVNQECEDARSDIEDRVRQRRRTRKQEVVGDLSMT